MTLQRPVNTGISLKAPFNALLARAIHGFSD